MLSKLLGRNRLNHKDPAVRSAAIGELDPNNPEHHADLARLASEDPDTGVRCSAIGALHDPEALKALLGDSQARVVRAAAERCATLANQGHSGLLEHPDVAWHVALTGALPNPALLDRLAEEQLVTLALQARTAAVRQAAAARITTEQGLEDLVRAARNRDKSTWRSARSRLEELQGCRQAQADHAGRCQDLADRVAETLAAQDPDSQHKAAHLLEQADAALQALALANTQAGAWHLAAVSVAPLEATLADLREQLAAAQAEAQAPAVAPDVADGATATAGADADADADAAPAQDTDTPPPADLPEQERARYEGELEAAALALETLHEQLRRHPDTWLAPDTHSNWQQIEQRWLAAADHVPPPAALATAQHTREHLLVAGFAAAERLQAVLEPLQAATGDGVPAVPDAKDAEGYPALWAFQAAGRDRAQTLSRLERKVAWPDDLPRPDVLVRAVAAREALEAADQIIHDRHEALKSQVQAAENDLDQALTAGDLHAARDHFKACRALVQCLPKGSARRLQQRFGALAHQLHELQDWQTFATHPKREELTTAMQALADTPKDPADQADAIRELRTAWNGLGPVTSPEDHRLAKRFNAAAETAFETCRAWYKEQAEQRSWNLSNREKICTELGNYIEATDWSGTVDWRAAERILRAARKEWQRYSPVDRKAAKAVEKRFEDLATGLHERISGQYAANLAAKQAIVAEAEALVGADTPLKDRTNTAKNLQSRWKQVGLTPRKPDQALWKRFRKACDAVFAERADAQAARDTATAEHRQQAEAVCQELEVLVRDSSADSADKATLRAVQQRFGDHLDALPPAKRGGLDKRFRQAVDGYKQLLAEQEKLATLQHGRTLLAAHADPAALDPTALPARLRERVEAGGKADGASRHQLTVRLEILAEVASPAEDQALRMQTQVERLNAGLGGSGGEPELLELLVDWLHAAPGDDASPSDELLAQRADQALLTACRKA